MKRSTRILVALTLLLGWTSPVVAGPMTVGWTGPADGDSPAMTIFFTPAFFANELTTISGQGRDHNKGDTSVVFTIDLHVDGSWVTIDSWTLPDASDQLLAVRTTGGPIMFAGGVIDGLRLTDSTPVVFGFHGMYEGENGATTFTFDTVASTTPEPTSVALWGMAAASLTGYFGWRRRKQAD